MYTGDGGFQRMTGGTDMQKVKQGNRRRIMNSVKTRLTLVVLLVMAMPLIIAICINYVIQMNEAGQTMDQLNAAQVQNVEQEFVKVASLNYGVLQTVANSDSTRRVLLGRLDRSTVQTWLTAVDHTMDDGNMLMVVKSDGMQLLREEGECEDVSGTEFFNAVKDTDDFYASNVQISSTGERYCTFAFPVHDEEGGFLGLVQRNYNLSLFDELVRSGVIEENEQVLIADRNGDLVAHSGLDLNSQEVNMASEPWFTDTRNVETASGDYNVTSEGTDWRVSYFKEPTTGWITVIYRDVSVSMQSARNAAVIVIIVGAVLLLIAGFVVYLLANSFTEPIYAINETFTGLRNGEFRKIDKFSSRKDEFGEIVNNTNGVIDHLTEVITDIKESSEFVGSQARELSNTSEQIRMTTESVSTAVQEVAKGATGQADTIQKASENLNNLSGAIRNVAQNAEGLAGTAGSINEASKTSVEALQKLAVNMQSMSGSMSEIKDAMNATSGAVKGVNEMVDMITSIASQTNLLALNASIEAARAGDSGRGFAVVAEEIGKLASDSSDTADKIREEMMNLLKVSERAIAKTNEVSSVSENVNGVLADTVDTINSLIREVEDTVGGIQNISELTQECDASKGVIVDAMVNLSAISEENAASTQVTGVSVEGLDTTAAALADSASNLNEVAKKLEDELEFFKI